MVCTYLKWRVLLSLSKPFVLKRRPTSLIRPNLKILICMQFYHVKKVTLSTYCVDSGSLRIKAIITDIFTLVGLTVWRNISDISFKRKIKMNVLFDLIFP